ncbi:YafY family protein [Frankia sp. QA3]|uniref:helix-turn-helix transcriptional regulator n=1 Tax=Frankia sp. QA3 TaxID=710111 RepID=UPI000269CAA3|nr:transcriptional regulator [Frankia sp. QA3]EIV93083.1 putative transcriptional regulator [Frankia sp. QA3]
MRSSRLTALLLHLQAVRRATAAELAAELEVSVRTVHRDIAALQDAGVPLWTEPGRAGGVRLMDGWRTSLDGLTGDEAAALLLLGAGPEVLGGLGLAAVAAAVRTKVLATLPPRPRAQAGQVRQRFLLDAPGWFHREEAVPHLAVLAEAVWAGRRVDLRYARPGDGAVTAGPAGQGTETAGTETVGDEAGRGVALRVDPLGLVCKAGTWYLVARHRSDVRSYRVGRIAQASLRAETFDRPDDFDLAAWWRAGSDEFARSLLRWTCRLRLSPAALRGLRHAVDPFAARDALAGASTPDGDGWRVVDLATEGPDVALSQLLALGDGVEVLAPEDLRAALAETGRRMAARNAPGTDGGVPGRRGGAGGGQPGGAGGDQETGGGHRGEGDGNGVVARLSGGPGDVPGPVPSPKGGTREVAP